MNKITFTLLAFISINVSAIPNPPDLGVGSYILYEPNTNKVLVSFNSDAPVEPASRTVEVEAFCSWSACNRKIRSIALATTGFTGYSAAGTANIICRKFSA